MGLTKKFRVGLLERIRKTPASGIPGDTILNLCDYSVLGFAFLTTGQVDGLDSSGRREAVVVGEVPTPQIAN
jgi:hypothetical protein